MPLRLRLSTFMFCSGAARWRAYNAMSDRRGPYLSRLLDADLPRRYWSHQPSDSPGEVWYFETVQDGDDHIAIRQLTVLASGERYSYSPSHLGDDWGFLTDQPLHPGEMEPSSPSAFLAAWDGSSPGPAG